MEKFEEKPNCIDEYTVFPNLFLLYLSGGKDNIELARQVLLGMCGDDKKYPALEYAVVDMLNWSFQRISDKKDGHKDVYKKACDHFKNLDGRRPAPYNYRDSGLRWTSGNVMGVEVAWIEDAMNAWRSDPPQPKFCHSDESKMHPIVSELKDIISKLIAEADKATEQALSKINKLSIEEYCFFAYHYQKAIEGYSNGMSFTPLRAWDLLRDGNFQPPIDLEIGDYVVHQDEILIVTCKPYLDRRYGKWMPEWNVDVGTVTKLGKSHNRRYGPQYVRLDSCRKISLSECEWDTYCKVWRPKEQES